MEGREEDKEKNGLAGKKGKRGDETGKIKHSEISFRQTLIKCG